MFKWSQKLPRRITWHKSNEYVEEENRRHYDPVSYEHLSKSKVLAPILGYWTEYIVPIVTHQRVQKYWNCWSCVKYLQSSMCAKILKIFRHREIFLQELYLCILIVIFTCKTCLLQVTIFLIIKAFAGFQSFRIRTRKEVVKGAYLSKLLLSFYW